MKGTHLPGEPSEGCLVERATVALSVTSLGFQSQSLRALRRQLCLECLNLACRLLEIVRQSFLVHLDVLGDQERGELRRRRALILPSEARRGIQWHTVAHGGTQWHSAALRAQSRRGAHLGALKLELQILVLALEIGNLLELLGDHRAHLRLLLLELVGGRVNGHGEAALAEAQARRALGHLLARVQSDAIR